MSKKTLIILLVVVLVGILVIVFAGRKADYTEEFVPVDDDAILDVDDFQPFEPVEDDLMEEEPVEDDLMEEELL